MIVLLAAATASAASSGGAVIGLHHADRPLTVDFGSFAVKLDTIGPMEGNSPSVGTVFPVLRPSPPVHRIIMRLDSTYIVTPQLDRAVAFYSLLFQRDPTVILPWSEDGLQRGAIYDIGDGQHFILSQERGFEEVLFALNHARSPFFLVFTVSNVQVEYARLRQAGVQIPKPPGLTSSGAIAFEFQDPDGHGIRISEVWSAPSGSATALGPDSSETVDRPADVPPAMPETA